MAWSDLYASWSLTGIPCRPYRDERTGSFSTSEGKRHRARLVLGWGTAREVFRVLSADATVIMAALPSAVEPHKRDGITGLDPSWSLTGIPCRMHRIVARPRPPRQSSGCCQLLQMLLRRLCQVLGGGQEKERVRSDLYQSWSLTAIPSMARWHLASLRTTAPLRRP